MPNWVYNTVSIEGEAEKVTALQTRLAAPYKGVDTGEMNYLNLIAPPDEHWEEYNCGPVSLDDKKANAYNWYDWNMKHWGVKWNACSGDGANVQESPNGNLYLTLRFESPWGPPVGIMEALFEVCQEQGLDLDWYLEEEQGWGEEWETVEGRFVMVKSWDIPSSHADHKNIHSECVCSWLEDEEEWYNDCPRPAKVDNTDNNQQKGN